MKKAILKTGWAITRFGDRHNIRFLTYNPITWASFFVAGRRDGTIFSNTIRELFPQIRSALDVGAGSGGYVASLNRNGVRSIGFEYSGVGRALGRLQGAKLIAFDCSNPATNPNLGRFDLIFSIEVGEHIPTEFSSNFVEFITNHGDFVMFSSAFPGQGGHGHINEQTKEFWQLLFEERGFQKCESTGSRISKRLKELGYKGWLPTNLQVFKKSISETQPKSLDQSQRN